MLAKTNVNMEPMVDDLIRVRNRSIVDFIHGVCEYAETREPSRDERVRTVEPMIDEGDLSVEQAAGVVVAALVMRLNDLLDKGDMTEFALSLSDLTAAVTYLSVTHRADQKFLDDTWDLIRDMGRILGQSEFVLSEFVLN